MQAAEPDPHEYRVLDKEKVFQGRVISVYREQVAMPGGGDSARDIVRHPGAVAVAALDEQDRIVLVRQYRHAVGDYMWELPAGLRDADGEPPLETGRRELAEEAQLAAAEWWELATVNSSPGFSDELVLIYLAEDLTVADRPDGFVIEHEELDMTVERVPLADVVQWVFDGRIRNSSAIVGILAAAQARSGGVSLRQADAV
jgi:8-oxo-dGDP phosphatase